MKTTHTPMMARRLSVFLLLAFFAVDVAHAQFGSVTRNVTKRGTTAADFLSIPVGARGAAMGGAVTASVNDASAIYWNPAGLAEMRNGAGFMAEYAQWLAGIDFNFASVVLPAAGGTVGLGVTSMRTGEMDVTTVDQQNGTGETFSAGSFAVSASYGRALTDRFSLGLTGKYVNERIWNSSANGFAIDVGTMFITPFRDVRLGAAITNFGTKLQMAGDDLLAVIDIDPNNQGNNESNRAFLKTDAFDMPLVMRIGLAGEAFQSESSRLTLAVEALNPNNSEQYLNFGAELGLLGDLIMFRGGYSEVLLDESVRSVTLGGGLHYTFGPLDLKFDYAYEAQEFFDNVNRFTFSAQF
ncbi:MAG: hypothetical protein RhofKO_05370 [Rhodothermales bacterium]